jgi:hypothetical protein
LVDFSKLSREDGMVLGGGVLLIIGLFAFAWYSVGGGSVGGVALPSYTAAATSSPYAIWGILALIVTIAVVVDLALARFSPQTVIPTTQLGRDMTRVAACGLLLLLLFIKFIAHVGDFGWGFFVDVILALLVSYGAWALAQGKASPLMRTPSTPTGGTEL